MLDGARKVLQQVYGYPEFREGQKNIITNLLEGRDTLGIMPTGGGKSICYQVPALLMEGRDVGHFPSDLLDEGSGGCA